MSPSGYHVPVMLEECMAFLQVKPGGLYFDGTVGGGGHSGAILERGGRIIGTDQDADALSAASKYLEKYGKNVTLFHARFSQFDALLDELSIPRIDGAILDLGVSSYMLDNPARGFSYMHDGPLDMRMGNSALTARDVINDYAEADLARIFFTYGEEKWAKRIAQIIVERRLGKPIETTLELVDAVKRAVPKGARQEGIHPAKRVFQAVRVEVNDELGDLPQSVKSIATRLATGGRLVVCDFQSLEDRIVKQAFRELANPCENCPEPPREPCKCDRRPVARILTKKPVTPSIAELTDNHRARSTKLRAAERL